MFSRIRTALVLTIMMIAPASGCNTFSRDGAALPPEHRGVSGGLLLKTGAIQLGPGVGRNAYGWQAGQSVGLR